MSQRKLDRFWKVWSDDYLRNLPPSVPKFQKKGQLREGSVVLIHEDNLPRLRWPVGIVVKLYPGRDGLVRAVDVRTKKGVYTRSVQRLHDLELAGNFSDSAVSDSVSVPESVQPGTDSTVVRCDRVVPAGDKPIVTRYGRVVKKRVV